MCIGFFLMIPKRKCRSAGRGDPSGGEGIPAGIAILQWKRTKVAELGCGQLAGKYLTISFFAGELTAPEPH
ncbi:hypothetical protein AWR36_011355 [Microbulbifer flavimaris]|uniref:Uncharacterized protein n=1 Tax=Microbulbifer flavimaris TaxID=1781068 RepID=A0ABX4HZA6_9GAMM|nr:hypothetical protein AVO43_11330 [Microbulbifer sp. ZGT114]PCO05308.1 hypothetical protein AWR36_011355 [Microbulbifer flavimaris]